MASTARALGLTVLVSRMLIAVGVSVSSRRHRLRTVGHFLGSVRAVMHTMHTMNSRLLRRTHSPMPTGGRIDHCRHAFNRQDQYQQQDYPVT